MVGKFVACVRNTKGCAIIWLVFSCGLWGAEILGNFLGHPESFLVTFGRQFMIIINDFIPSAEPGYRHHSKADTWYPRTDHDNGGCPCCLFTSSLSAPFHHFTIPLFWLGGGQELYCSSTVSWILCQWSAFTSTSRAGFPLIRDHAPLISVLGPSPESHISNKLQDLFPWLFTLIQSHSFSKGWKPGNLEWLSGLALGTAPVCTCYSALINTGILLLSGVLFR